MGDDGLSEQYAVRGADKPPEPVAGVSEVTRRRLLTAAGLGVAGLAVVGTGADVAQADRPERSRRSRAGADPGRTPPVAGLHLQFGADASREVVVSWHTLQPVARPRVLLGRPDGAYERTVNAETVSYTDAKSGRVVYAHHGRLGNLRAGSAYVYGAWHEGTDPELASFRTAPSGRSAFVFTSFGDQGTPTVGKRYAPPPGVSIPNPPYVNDNLGSPAAGDTTAGVERVQPLFHLFNGDLCYANLSQDRVRTWWDFWDNNSRSARNRPWMPAAGNHENELGNGPIGFEAYQTYFALPKASGQAHEFRSLWYAFTAGSVRFISVGADDVCYQDGGNSYVRGYSHGAQTAWLENELATARDGQDIDWVVVCMHQVVISTADKFNGADLGIRQEWVPLFDRYGVDLVLCGHEHHYERSHPIRGQRANATLTPVPASTRTDLVDTTRGTVHMVLGGGGTSVPSNGLFFNPPACRVITAVTAPDPTTGKRAPVYVREPAPWSAVRDAANSYGFAAFAVEPGSHGETMTRIVVTYYDVLGTGGELKAFETFTLTRPRADAAH